MKQQGFSLLELSIVLVIIGLIAGGIVAGSSMIRAAELRTVITEKEQYQTAVHTFRDKYLGLPGDLKNATAFWGAAHATPATCLTTVGTGTQTCNGNGDRIMTEAANDSEYGERFMFWQHLANAGLINGSFTGIAGSGGHNHSIIGENSPEARMSGSAWMPHYILPAWVGDAWWFGDTPYYNFMVFGSASPDHLPWHPILSPEEVWNIDTKLDDGKPGQGKVIVGWYEPCTDRAAGENSAAHAQAAEYDLTNKNIACGILFPNVF